MSVFIRQFYQRGLDKSTEKLEDNCKRTCNQLTDGSQKSCMNHLPKIDMKPCHPPKTFSVS